MPRKVVGASCVAIVDFGEEGEAYNFMMNLDESVKSFSLWLYSVQAGLSKPCFFASARAVEEASRQVRDSPTLAGEVCEDPCEADNEASPVSDRNKMGDDRCARKKGSPTVSVHAGPSCESTVRTSGTDARCGCCI